MLFMSNLLPKCLNTERKLPESKQKIHEQCMGMSSVFLLSVLVLTQISKYYKKLICKYFTVVMGTDVRY